jgi:hypothetical protein
MFDSTPGNAQHEVVSVTMTDTNIPPAVWAGLGFDVVVRFMAENLDAASCQGNG